MQGAYVPQLPSYADSGRYSEVESIATRQSQATFAPPYAGSGPSDRNLAFQKPAVFVDDTPTKVWTNDSFRIEDFEQEKRRRRRKAVLVVVALFLLIGTVGAVGYLFGVEEDNDVNGENNNVETDSPTVAILLTDTPTVSPTSITSAPTLSPTSVTDVPTVSPTRGSRVPTLSPTLVQSDFCAPLGVTDKAMRTLLVEGFDTAIADGGVGQIFYRFISGLVCLPADAWSDLSAAQANTLANLAQGIRISGFLQLIHPDAFNPDLVGTHTRLNLVSNQLTTLPDGVFRHFTSMTALTLGSNNFVTLNNNILGNLPQLDILAMNTCPFLEEFPEFMPFAPNLRILQFAPTPAIANANRQAFVGLNNLQSILFHNGITPIVNQLGRDDLAKALGIDAGVIAIALDFCASFGFSDNEVRQLLADSFDGAQLTDGGTELVFNNINGLTCLPDNAFSLLSAEQKLTLANLGRGIRLQGVGLEIIHQDAFDPDLFGNHILLNLASNSLVNLPNRVMEAFPSIGTLILSGNPFVTLRNDIFGSTGAATSLTRLPMNSCNNLIEFPEIMLFTPNLINLQLQSAVSLSKANAQAFANLINLATIQILLTNDVTPVLNDLGLDGLAQELGIDASRFFLN